MTGKPTSAVIMTWLALVEIIFHNKLNTDDRVPVFEVEITDYGTYGLFMPSPHYWVQLTFVSFFNRL